MVIIFIRAIKKKPVIGALKRKKRIKKIEDDSEKYDLRLTKYRKQKKLQEERKKLEEEKLQGLHEDSLESEEEFD